jgi:hypothetical protein
MLCVMSTIVAELVAAGAQQLEDLGLHVTSSAVVGSSAMISPAFERERHRDHDALLLPARELVRVVVDAPLGIGMPTLRRSRSPSPRASSGEPPVVRAQALGDLPAHGEDGVQGRRRLLEDHRRVRARASRAASR